MSSVQDAMVHPDSPVDSTMFPPQYDPFTASQDANVDQFLSIGVSEKDVDPPLSFLRDSSEDLKEDTCVVYDCELEPFDYNPKCLPAKYGSLNSVFGDELLVEEIFNSLKAESDAAKPSHCSPQVAIAPLTIKAPEINPNMFLTFSSTPLTTPMPVSCIRKPGTFLNKDGRWIKGKPCRMEKCDKRAQSNGLCKGHGGGARCSKDGCNKSSQGGGFCRAHGGGKRCMFDGCEKGTQRNGFCYLHGGVRSCSVEGCEKKDRGNGKCFSHGGGRRCQAPYCTQAIRRGTHCECHQPSSAK